jgi:hypothetical protein
MLRTEVPAGKKGAAGLGQPRVWKRDVATPRNQQERGSHRSVGRRLGAAGVSVRASGPLWQHLAAPSPCQLAAGTVVRERTIVVFVEG